MEVGKKIQMTQPLILFEEEEEMFKKVNEIFHSSEVKKSLNNINFNIAQDEEIKEAVTDNNQLVHNNNEYSDGLYHPDAQPLYQQQYQNQQDPEAKEGFFSTINSYWEKLYKPDDTFFDYKPSYYQYQTDEDNTPVDDNPYAYSRQYNDKNGNKIRKIKIISLNDKIDNISDNLHDQYWWNRNDTNMYDYDADNFNFMLMDKDEVEIPDNDKVMEDSGKLVISALKNILTDKKKNEEEEEEEDEDDENYDPSKPQEYIDNNPVNTIDFYKIKQQIDDLQELLDGSTAYAQAKYEVNFGRYVDKKFPANEYSIYGYGERNDYSLSDLKQLPWIRPDEFFQGEDYQVFDTIHSNDIEQGGLGDCYLLASISAIAEYPERLERLFLVKESNEQGIYVVAMCLNGIWEEIVMDDLIPCTKYSKKPAFNRSKSNELWVILIEKAWAKAHGGYMNIAAGLTRETLRDLTGASCITYFTSQNREELWERLVQANFNKHIMTAGSDNLNNGSDSYIEKIGIAGSHAYSLLEVYELENIGYNQYRVLTPDQSKEGMNIERLLKLRNPWGKGEWKGDWSDDSSKWTYELKQELNWESVDDGVFYMSWNDFLKYYSDLQICYYHDGYKYSAIKLTCEKDQSIVVKFTLELAGKYYFSVNQKNRRFFPKSKRYSYTDMHFLCARKIDGDKFDYIGANIRADKENWIGVDVDVGEFYVIIKCPWKSFVNEFSFSVYGPDKTEFEVVSQYDLPSNFLQKMLISHALEDTETQVQSFDQQGHPDISYRTFDNKGGFGYIFFQNNSEDTTLQATVELLGSRNIKIAQPYNGLRPSCEVGPGEIDLIPYEATSLPYSAQMRLMSVFKSTEKTDSLRDQVRASTTILSKSYNGKAVDIQVYVLYHVKGLALLYVNNSQYSLSEELEFQLENCHIDGAYGSFIEIVVEPGRERLVRIDINDPNEDFVARIKKLYYKVF